MESTQIDKQEEVLGYDSVVTAYFSLDNNPDDVSGNWVISRAKPSPTMWEYLLFNWSAKTRCPHCLAPALREVLLVSNTESGEERLLSQDPARKGLAIPKFILCSSGHICLINEYAFCGDANEVDTYILDKQGKFHLLTSVFNILGD